MGRKGVMFFFAYSWNPERRLDAYQQALLDEFIRVGFDVRIYLASQSVRFGAQFGVNPFIENRVVRDIHKYKPKLIFSMNQGLLSDKICEATEKDVRIATWIVDDPSHIFFPNVNKKSHESKVKNTLHPRVQVIVSSSQIYREYLEHCDGVSEENLFFLSSVSNPKKFSECPVNYKRNIVFIGSYLDTIEAERLLIESLNNVDEYNFLKEILYRITNSGDARAYLIDNLQRITPFLKRQGINELQLEQLMTNLVSSNKRRRAVLLLKGLGIEVFGNVGWVSGLSGDLEALKCFKAKKIQTQDDLVATYNSSKIAIQIPQLQVGPALSYRVFDIMASGALLIHPYREDSDLFHFFGKDCPVPCYKDEKELKQLCEYYLVHEDERLELVKKCNDLVKVGFSFEDRVRFIVGDKAMVKVPETELGRVVKISSLIKLSFMGFLFKGTQLLFTNPRGLLRSVSGRFKKKSPKLSGRMA